MISYLLISFAFALITFKTEFSLQVDLSNKSLTTAEIVRARGYIAEEHLFVTSDGYKLKLVRALNPLINEGESGLENKDPVLFIHGSVTISKCFVINSDGAEPKNYGKLDAGSMDVEELNDLLGDDPASKSLVFTALNFGHEVWLLGRRGTIESPGHVKFESLPYSSTNAFFTLFGGLLPAPEKNGDTKERDKIARLIIGQDLESINKDQGGLINNPKYWNFSQDEQALIDLPEVIDYVLEETDREKLAIVGHSTGGALPLMMLSDLPEIAKKISKSILWAPALYIGDTDRVNLFIKIFEAIVSPFGFSYLGPFPTYTISNIIGAVAKQLVSTEIGQQTAGKFIDELVFGLRGFQQVVEPKYLEVGPKPVGSHELISLRQAIRKKKMHHFDYENKKRNMIAYGRPKPPVYNVSKIISTTMSLWFGATDTLVPPTGMDGLKNDLTVPAEFHLLNQTGYFNHFSFLIHNQVGKLLNIPSLKVLESV